MDVDKNLVAPMDSHNSITGQPAYTLTVSISDTAIGALRTSIGSSVAGNVIAADNLVPR